MSRLKCVTCGLNPPHSLEEDALEYDPQVECEGCHVRNGNILNLLDSILKVAKKQGLVRDDLTLEEFNGPMALMILDNMEERENESN